MRVKPALVAAAVLALGGCETPAAPKWNIDLFFPIKYPDIPLTQVAGVIPNFDVTFTAPADSDVVSDASRQVLDQEIDTLRAAISFSTATNITGNLQVSIAANRAFLFSTSPQQAVTVNIPMRVTAGDTTRITVSTALFKNATKLYTQSRGIVRSGTGGFLAVGPSDRLSIGVDLTASIKVSK